MYQTTPRAVAFKIIAIVLVASFSLAAVACYNDPDPGHRMLFYLTSAVCCLLTVLRKDNLPLLYISIGMAVLEMAIIGDGFLVSFREGAGMNMGKSYLTLRRDFLGVCISLLVLVCLAIRLRSSAPR